MINALFIEEQLIDTTKHVATFESGYIKERLNCKSNNIISGKQMMREAHPKMRRKGLGCQNLRVHRHDLFRSQAFKIRRLIITTPSTFDLILDAI